MKRNKGFTLLEVVVVVVIITILAMVAMPKFLEMRREMHEEKPAVIEQVQPKSDDKTL